MRLNRLFVAGIFVYALLSAQASSAWSASVAADLDKTTAKVREEIRLVIRIMDVQGNIQAPRIPGMDGFDIFYTGRSSQLSFINGQSSSSVEFSYLLVPQKTGQFALPPIEISAGGQSFRTEPAQIQILPGDSMPSASVGAPSAFPPIQNSLPPSSQQPVTSQTPPVSPPPIAQPDDNAGPADENIYVLAQADKASVYPGEQILLTYSLYTRYDTRYEGFKEEPEVSGFWIEEYPMDQNVPRDTVTVRGNRYIRAIVKKYALFPTAAADYTIHPGVLKASVRKDPQNNAFDDFFNDSFFQGGGFFARREEVLLSPPPIKISVKPYPDAGKPKSFQGATGNFRLSAKVDKTDLKQDEPVTLTMTIEGEGNIETLPKPQIPDLENFRSYDGDTNHQLFKTGDRIGGRKTFELVFIPTTPGKRLIPSMEYSFFNPWQGTYQTLKSPEFVLNVDKSDSNFTLPSQPGGAAVDLKKDIELEKQDIRFIHETLNQETWNHRLKLSNIILAILNVLLGFLIALHWVVQKRSEFFTRNVALKRKMFAGSEARRGLRQLDGLLKKSEPAKELEFFEKIEQILTQYLTDKMNLSTLGITRYDLETKLGEVMGSDLSLLHQIQNVFNTCESARFAKASIGKDEKARVYKELTQILSQLDHLKI